MSKSRGFLSAVIVPLVRAAVASLLFFYASISFAESCNSWISCSLNGLRGQSVFEEISRFEERKHQELLREFAGNDQELVTRLATYKADVAKTSYGQTLKLCVAYRHAMGLGLPNHADATSLAAYGLEASLEAWGKIYAQGLYQSADSLAGLKSDYLSLSGSGFFDFESWFKSLYTMNFVTSSGFFHGAAHCLNTVSAREIQKFASAILLVDYEGSLVSQAALTWSMGKFIGLIVSPLNRWVLHPLKEVFAKVSARVSTPRLVVMGIPLGGFLADNLICRMARLEMAQKNLQSFLAQLNASSSEGQIKKRDQRVRMGQALRLAAALKTDLATCSDVSSGSLCAEARRQFVEQLRAARFAEQLPAYELDRQEIQAQLNAPTAMVTDPELNRKVYSCDGPASGVFRQTHESRGKLDLEQGYLAVLDVLIPLALELQKQNSL